MKIIIAGDGKVGSTLTRQLASEGYDITLIDSNASVLENSVERYDVMTVQGSCASMGVLQQAGIEDAELLIAVTSADEVNLLCCTTAHRLNENIHTIARVRNPEYAEQIYAMRDMFGLSMSVNPEKQAAKEIERLLKVPGFLKRESFAKGRVEIVELKIDEGSKLCDVSLNDVASIVKCQILVCAVKRGEETVTPDGQFILKKGDRISVTASTDNLSIMLKNLGITDRKITNVMICGGGRICYYLSKLLTGSGINVKIIEKSLSKCEMLAEMLPNVTIIHGDASDQELLEDEGLDRCDALVSLTGMDELNILISLYAKSQGVFQVITKLGHERNPAMLDSIQLGSTISPKELCCDNIIRYVRAMNHEREAALTVHALVDGAVEAMEFRVDDKCKYKDTPLKQLKIRKEARIACIIHGLDTIIPNGDSSFTTEDTLIVVSGNNIVINSLNDIFLK